MNFPKDRVETAGRCRQRYIKTLEALELADYQTLQQHISTLDMARLDVTEVFHGISFPGHVHTQDSLEYALKFQFQDTDILIVSYPKSGKKRRQTQQDT